MSDDESRAIFREEALDLLAELDATLLELENSPHDLDLVNQVFRALHTIKGSGAMFGFDDIANFTHSIENVFDKVRTGGLEVSSELITTTLAARDHILGLLNGVDEEGNGSPERGEAIQADVRDLVNGVAVVTEPVAVDTALEAPVEPVSYRIRIRPREPKVDKELSLDPLFEDLRALGRCEVRVDMSRLPVLDALDTQTLYLAWEVLLDTTADRSAIQDLFFFTDIDLDVDIAQADAEGRFNEPENWPQSDGPADTQAAPSASVAPMPGSVPENASESASGSAAAAGPVIAEASVKASAKAPAAVPATPPPAPGASAPRASETGSGPVKDSPKNPPKEASTTKGALKDSGNSLRVSADKLDTLVDLVGELVIVQAQISQIVSERSDPILTSLAEQLERLSADLRDSTLGIRMLPIGSAFSKFRRLVRDLSSELGKDIELVTRGEETELDKTVLERLGDPLVHLLRNSIDHGIDMPAERQAAGKRPQGLILLEAEHSGSEVLIRIIDDGKGMDPDLIRKKAAEKGLIAHDVEISDQEALKLIFLPGFSTAAKVTSISGRGVGMDVVHRAIDSLRGAIEIKSELGHGTTITIRLPLTLAIIEGLQVQVGDGFFVIPLSLVEECVELHQQDVDPSGRKRIINLRGELVPYISLRRWFDIEGDAPEIEQIVITGIEGRRIGIVVDHVIGEHQTVIKSLGRVYRDVEGISGATIKGDGSLALILDVPRLVRSVVSENSV